MTAVYMFKCRKSNHTCSFSRHKGKDIKVVHEFDSFLYKYVKYNLIIAKPLLYFIYFQKF